MRSASPGPCGTSPMGLSPTPSGATTPLLSRAPTPPLYLPSRVLDSRQRHKLAVERVNFRWRLTYLSDLYHTLVNCPWYRFYLLFVVFYLAMFAGFAALYISQPGCISQVDNFFHALWFSVQSSATIGYGHQSPDPDCYLLQWFVTAQVLVSLLFQASLLGVVFARISNASCRSVTIRFSKAMLMYRAEDGLYRLAFRVANLRQHQVLSPKVRMLLLRRQHAHPFTSGSWEYVYSELPSAHIGGGHLWLGVPSVIEHKVDHRSALYGLNEADIMSADMEFIVLLGGVDESTSRVMEARHSYVPADIRWQHNFDPCIQRRRSGKLGVDFARFDSTKLRGSGQAAAPAGSAGTGPASLPSNSPAGLPSNASLGGGLGGGSSVLYAPQPRAPPPPFLPTAGPRSCSEAAPGAVAAAAAEAAAVQAFLGTGAADEGKCLPDMSAAEGSAADVAASSPFASRLPFAANGSPIWRHD